MILPKFVVSPTEPPLIRAMGAVGGLPEKNGVDIIWLTKKDRWLIGIQRKEWRDLFASQNFRLPKQIDLMHKLKVVVLVIEGRIPWTLDGRIADKHYSAWTKSSLRRWLWTIRSAGISIEWSDDIPDTINAIYDLAAWLEKDKHASLYQRVSPRGNGWGPPTPRDVQTWALQSVAGVGHELADRIIEEIPRPLRWSCTKERLGNVPGVGPKRLEKLWTVFS